MDDYEKIISVEESDNYIKLKFIGEMTIYTAAQIKEELVAINSILVNGKNNISINVSGVSDFDTSGLQLLMMAKKNLVLIDKNVNIIGHSDSVIEAMRLYKMDGQMESASYDDEVIQALAG